MFILTGFKIIGPQLVIELGELGEYLGSPLFA